MVKAGIATALGEPIFVREQMSLVSKKRPVTPV
jgi:hypothetical protein